MSLSTQVRKGDTFPALRLVCKDDPTNSGTTTPVDLTAATEVRVLAYVEDVSTPVFSRVVTVSGTEGVVTMPWESGDTSLVRELHVVVKVTWPGGGLQTFPVKGHIVVWVEDEPV